MSLSITSNVAVLIGIVGATPLRATVSDGALKQQLIRLVTDQKVR